MINFAKSKDKYGMMIYYQLLIGEQYEKTDEYELAETFFTEAYQEAKKHLPARHHKYYLLKQQNQKTFFDPIDRLAYFYLTIGNLKHAAQLFQESKTLRDNFFPQHSIHRVHPVVGMGSYYFKKNQYDKTYAQFSLAQQMMNRATTTGYDFDNLNGLFLNDMVDICLRLGNKEAAWKYLNQLSIASSGFSKFSSAIAARLEVARVFELKSRYYLTFGDFRKAQEYLDKSNRYNPTNVATSEIKLKLLRTEALLNWYQGRLDQAALAFQKLTKEYQQNIHSNFASMSDYEREQFYYTLKNDNRLKNQILRSGNQSLIDKLDQWEKAKDQLAALYFEKNTPEQIESLEKSIESLERDINQAFSSFQKKGKEVSWKEIKSSLKEGEAALEIVRVNAFDKQNPNRSAIRNGLTDSVLYAVLMITPSSAQPQCFQMPMGNKLESHYLPYYRNSILTKTDDKLTYNNFWQPIKKYLNGIKRVYLSADGSYNQINLNTLKNTATNNYVIDEIELVLLTNTADLLSTASSNESKGAFLIGRPAFEFSVSQISTALSTPTVSLANGMRSLAKDELVSFKEQNFTDLPGTEEEVSVIASVLQKQNTLVTSYIGTDALEENVKALKNPEILHIATHGFFIEDTASSVSPMIRSGIILAGVRNASDEAKEDGILTAYEATNLDLEGTDLVALSACQTGLGEVRNGEGVYGLQRSIIVAGAKNLLMSLWKVDDAATAKLMSSFYQLRSGKKNQEAFREAQIQLRQAFPEPFYWGAFVMLGK
ncbi:MAG: CHAT domain-containing protein [Bacteroidetes bacterium]|nr:CHAT domain-containing protein [Bacteroidota bacterium]